MKLKLFNLHVGPYKVAFIDGALKETTVNAYVYFTKKVKGKEEACDNNVKLIGSFMNQQHRNTLEAMVKNKIQPTIEEGFMNTPYHVTGIDFTNMAPHPHLVIARRDGKAMLDADVTAISESINKTIEKKNSAAINKASQRNNMFEQAKKM